MALVQPRQQKEDDITAVLGRFKAWNTSLDGHRDQESEVFTGLEEISYEEALGDLRRILPRTAPPPPVDLAAAVDMARDTVSLSAAGQLQTMQAKSNGALESSPAAAEKITGSPVASTRAASSSTILAEPASHLGVTVPQRALPQQQKKTSVRADPSNKKKTEKTALCRAFCQHRRKPRTKA